MSAPMSIPDLWTKLKERSASAGEKTQLEYHPDLYHGDLAAVQGDMQPTGEFNVLNSAYASGADPSGLTASDEAFAACLVAAKAAGGKMRVPAGTYLLTDRYVHDGSVQLVGDGMGVTTIKMQTGASADSVIHVGVTDSSDTQTSYAGICNLTIDANSAASYALFQWNACDLVVSNVQVKNATSHGINSDSHTGLETSLCERNTYINIRSSGNGGDGFVLGAQREASLIDIRCTNCTGNGLAITPYIEGSSPSLHAVAVYHTVNVFRAIGCGGDGLVLDTVQRCSFEGITTDQCGGVGLRVKTTGPDDAVAIGSNSFTMTNAWFRWSDGGGLVMDEGTYWANAELTNVIIMGEPGGPDDVPGMVFRGATYLQFTNTEIFAVSSTAITIQDGTPLGVAGESRDLSFTNTRLLQNGSAGSATKHGISIQDASFDIAFNRLDLANAQTTGSFFEIDVGANALDMHFTDVQATPNGGVNNLWQIGSGAEDEISVCNIRLGSNTYIPTVASASSITVPPCDGFVFLTGTTNIDFITPMRNGTKLTFLTQSGLTFNHNASGDGKILHTTGAVAVAANRTLTADCRGTAWYSER